MQWLKRNNRPMIISMFVVFGLMLLYRSALPVQQFDTSLFLRNEHIHEHEKQGKVLETTSIQNQTRHEYDDLPKIPERESIPNKKVDDNEETTKVLERPFMPRKIRNEGEKITEVLEITSMPTKKQGQDREKPTKVLERTTKPIKTKHDRELAKVLAKASMPNKTVILTTLNDAWAVPGSVIDLFLDSFRMGEGTQGLLKHLVIVNMDQKAFDRCKVIHNPEHCYSLTTPGVNFAAEKRFMTPEYLMLMWRRIDFLREVLELGYNFVFTDADIMWFRDPFPYFNAPDEIMIACDFYKGPPRSVANRANGGFNYVKSTQSSVKFYKYWYKARLLHPGAHDQSVFEIIKHEAIVKKLGLRIRYLDTAYFGGFCEPSRDMNKVCTMHANCCVGIERKINDLTLLLQDWKNFTMLSPEKRKLQGASSAVPWRAPDKCKWW